MLQKTPIPVEIRRSARRRTTVMVFRENGRLVASVPSRLPAGRTQTLVQEVAERFLRQERSRRVPTDECELVARAQALFDKHIAAAVTETLPPFTVRWVGNQQRRWGSCTQSEGTIRLSERIRDLPSWVVDCVLLHETLHLIEYGHTPRFRRLLARYPLAERARGFLEGYQAAGGLPSDGDEGG